jgi:O-antigen ligase
VAPWATLEAAVGLAVTAALALTAARMASTRTGLPALLGMLTLCGALLAVLGLAGEAGGRERVLLLRANTGGGGAYGPFVNSNHFALALELTLPAAVVLLAVAARHLTRRGEGRREGSVLALAAAVTLAIGGAALLRCGSRGGVLFLLLAAVLSVPLWLKPRRATRWPWLIAIVVLGAGIVTLAWTRLPALAEDFKQLLAIEGVEGNSRVDLWAGSWRLAERAPVLGCGLGAYRHAIGLDKPATSAAALEQAHNDWVEWAATTGAAGAVVLLVALVGVAWALRPPRVRWMRFEYRYPLAGTAVALLATALHEVVDFGLHIPLNLYLLACWLGLLWGVAASSEQSRRRRHSDGGDGDGERAEPEGDSTAQESP